MTRIVPTIGRKLYYYEKDSPSFINADGESPFDATVLFVTPNSNLVNLLVVDHIGTIGSRHGVPLIQEDDPKPATGGYAQWMPFQIGQAAKDTSTQQSAANASESQTLAPAAVATPESSVASATPMPETPAESGSAPVETSSGNTTNQTPVQAAGAAVAPTADTTAQQASNYSSDFGGALAALRDGKKVARAGWNGKGMFVFLVPGSTFTVNRPPLLGIYVEGTLIDYMSHIDMKTADNKVVPWLASQSDVLAQDWAVVS